MMMMSAILQAGCTPATLTPIVIRMTATPRPATITPVPPLHAAPGVESTPHATAEEAVPVSNPASQSTPEDRTAGPTATVFSSGVKQEIKVIISDFAFKPSDMQVPYGATVQLELRNEGTYPHDFLISELGIYVDIPAGETKSVEFVAAKTGKHAFLCTKIDPFVHYDNGMWGTFSVEDTP